MWGKTTSFVCMITHGTLWYISKEVMEGEEGGICACTIFYDIYPILGTEN